VKKVIALGTTWEPDFWEKPQKAPFLKRTYRQLPDWEDLSKNCPLAGLGIYIKQKEKDYKNKPFVYLKIKGMRYNAGTEEPHFFFEPIKKSSTESRTLLDRLLDELGVDIKKKLFLSINPEKLINILRDIGEEPPKEWFDLIGLVGTPNATSISTFSPIASVTPTAIPSSNTHINCYYSTFYC